jgi:hypothetical protein
MNVQHEKIYARISTELMKHIKAFCLRHNIKNHSEFLRYAITQTLTPDIEDPELVFQSLKQLHEKIHTLEVQEEILFNFLAFFIRNQFAYHSEIPDSMKQAASDSAVQRYSKFFTAFKESLKQAPSLFESLLADYLEDAP